MASLPNELLIEIFACVERLDHSSILRISCWKYHRDLNLRTRGWIDKRVSFDTHTCRLVCQKWNILVLPRVFALVTIKDHVRLNSFVNLFLNPLAPIMALHLKSLTLRNTRPEMLLYYLKTLLPHLRSLRTLQLERPLRAKLMEDAIADSHLYSSPHHKCQNDCFALEHFVISDVTLDVNTAEQLSRCLQMFSRIETVHLLDVSFVGEGCPSFHTDSASTALAPKIHHLNMHKTNPSIARAFFYDDHRADLPSKLTVQLGDNPSSVRALTELLVLYDAGSAQQAPAYGLSDLTIHMEPFGVYSPLLKVDVDADVKALSGLCDVLRRTTHNLGRLKLELHSFDGNKFNSRKLHLLLKVIEMLPASLVCLTLDLTFFPEALCQALAAACQPLKKLESVQVAFHKKWCGKALAEHPAMKDLDDRGILQFFDPLEVTWDEIM
ncbi:hypothetical protein BC835DRAFT_1414159 [Cytidiella melzeri]|nr:hypothetical protein BC835DRAFT_1414159 [Cytidiella melzeri]